MTVLHCFGLMNRGGAETMLMNIYRYINKEKFQFDFLVHTHEPGDYDEEIRALGGKIYHISSIGQVSLLRYIKEFKKALANMQSIDIIHIHMDWQSGYIALAARLAGIKKVIVHSHTNGINNPTIAKRLAAACSKVLIQVCAGEKLACSADAAYWLFGYKKAHIIRNAIDITHYIQLNEVSRLNVRQMLQIQPEEILLCHVGSFSENKNQLFLIELIKRLNQQDKRYKLILIGRGDTYFSQVSQAIVTLNLQNDVKLLGVKDNVPEYLNASDIFLFPSKREGFGMVAVEAQAAGLYCIVSESIPTAVDIGLKLVQYANISNMDEWQDLIVRYQKPVITKEKIQQALQRSHLDIAEQVITIEDIYRKM